MITVLIYKRQSVREIPKKSLKSEAESSSNLHAGDSG